jgi:MFS transporter, MHS family, proline/betaine transporter
MAQTQAVEGQNVRRVVTGGTIGNFAEWYDYTLFGFSAAYLGAVFFPSSNPTTSLLASFATFAVTFFFRPLGGIVFGALADRVGRQRTLVVVILGITGATFAVGLLPGYETLGIAAPILLVLARILQGLSAGGEMGSSLSFLAEHAPVQRRGLVCSTLNIGACLGGLTSSGIFALLAATLSGDSMETWGWRIPFLLSGPLGLVAYYIRSRLDETPDFEALRQQAETAKAPVREAFRTDWKAMIVCFAFTMTHTMGFYMIVVYYPSVLSPVSGGSSEFAYLIAPVGYMAALVALPLTSHISDRVGRRAILLAACVGYIAVAIPSALLMGSGALWSTVLGAFMFGFCMGTCGGGPFAAMAEIFSTRTRTTGFSISYNAAAALFGGLAPFYLTYLADITGSAIAPGVCLIAAAFVTLVVTRGIADRSGASLDPTTASERSSHPVPMASA